ncbi:Probable RNA-directed DNA polymerase from transposon BS [Eumeta japonica]|uniref:Probable RNA-directed DNA polymerase from transposon BS n=1 Tax=Eumeta variegata TaxID=151549 RepID=A0A4C1U494_EUMVA|nr:Probable RNA-directed DNA polymerase from transposon BS [Eumeta japonica]
MVDKCEREVPASSDRWKFPPDILELIRAKNAALRRASAYPTPEYKSRAQALQREVKARVQEFRNESWSHLMKEIRPSHKAFWKVTKALKTEGHESTHSTRRPIRAGVPQGSALSPLLYSAYTNDIPRPSSGVQLALFADDTALFLEVGIGAPDPLSSTSRGPLTS